MIGSRIAVRNYATTGISVVVGYVITSENSSRLEDCCSFSFVSKLLAENMKKLRLIRIVIQRVLITVAVFWAALMVIHFTAITPSEFVDCGLDFAI